MYMNMRKFLALMLVGASAHMHAITPGMCIAFLQQVVSYAPQMQDGLTVGSWSSKQSYAGVAVRDVRGKLHIGLRGVQYKQLDNGISTTSISFGCNYIWNPYEHKNLIARAGITMALAACTSSVVDLIFKRCSLKEVANLSYLAKAAATGIGGSLLGVALKK